MQIQDIISHLETLAPPSLQESYDNSGLIVGDKSTNVSQVLICLDITEELIQEAIDKSCNLIIAHHPIIFSGIKKLNGKNYVERCIIKAIKNDIAIYAIHTNLDNVLNGVNFEIGKRLGLKNMKILDPKAKTLKKLVSFVPTGHKDEVLNALFAEGAGVLGNYSEASFQSKGMGTFKANEEAKPFVGKKDHRHEEEEIRIEVLLKSSLESKVVNALLKAHPYEEVAYEIYAIENKDNTIGSGMIGELEEETDALEFLQNIKKVMAADCLRFTNIHKKKIKKIAWCGGSGSFLLSKAIAAGSDLFMSSDFKYHQFFDADNQIIIADIGHYENEQYTINLIANELKKKFSTFAFLLTDTNTNPINYL
tara:strand:+ start:51693 stop:52787 length:1095 start_codon:yes stop_codon:yes gene_type:complete